MHASRLESHGLQWDPNITPMIDVLLVLLVIFMIALPQMRRAIDVQLPDPAAKGESVGIVLEVGPGARLAVNGQIVPPGRLGVHLRSIYDGRPDKTIMVRGDGTLTYGAVISAMDIARSAGVRVVGIDPRQRP